MMEIQELARAIEQLDREQLQCQLKCQSCQQLPASFLYLDSFVCMQCKPAQSEDHYHLQPLSSIKIPPTDLLQALSIQQHKQKAVEQVNLLYDHLSKLVQISRQHSLEKLLTQDQLTETTRLIVEMQLEGRELLRQGDCQTGYTKMWQGKVALQQLQAEIVEKLGSTVEQIKSDTDEVRNLLALKIKAEQGQESQSLTADRKIESRSSDKQAFSFNKEKSADVQPPPLIVYEKWWSDVHNRIRKLPMQRIRIVHLARSHPHQLVINQPDGSSFTSQLNNDQWVYITNQIVTSQPARNKDDQLIVSCTDQLVSYLLSFFDTFNAVVRFDNVQEVHLYGDRRYGIHKADLKRMRKTQLELLTLTNGRVFAKHGDCVDQAWQLQQLAKRVKVIIDKGWQAKLQKQI